MKEALIAHEEERWSKLRRPQGEAAWPTFKNAPDEVLAIARQKLADGTYGHFAE